MSFTVLVVIACISAALFIWAIFYSTSISLGKFLFDLNNRLSMWTAGLQRVEAQYNGQKYVYLSNNTQNNPIMLLLHGFSADKSIWLPFAKEASEAFTLVIPDLLGHGEIPYKPEQSYSTPEQVKYVQGLIQFLVEQQISSMNENSNEVSFVIVGNSMGGMTSALLNKEWQSPAKLSLTVLLDPAGAKTEFAQQMYASKQNPFIHGNAQTVFDFYQLAMNKPPFMPPCVYHYIAETNYLAKKTQFAHMFSDFFEISTFLSEDDVLPNHPLMIIWGEKDGLLPVSDALHWQKICGVEPIILKDIGHMPMVECPEQTFTLIKNAL